MRLSRQGIIIFGARCGRNASTEVSYSSRPSCSWLVAREGRPRSSFKQHPASCILRPRRSENFPEHSRSFQVFVWNFASPDASDERAKMPKCPRCNKEVYFGTWSVPPTQLLTACGGGGEHGDVRGLLVRRLTRTHGVRMGAWTRRPQPSARRRSARTGMPSASSASSATRCSRRARTPRYAFICAGG